MNDAIPKKVRGRPFPKGVSGNPSGKPRGALSRLTRAQAEFAASTGATPLQLLLAISRRDVVALRSMGFPPQACTPTLRVRAAESAAPYCHRKQPQGIDGGAEGTPVTVQVLSAEKLATMTDAQVAFLAETLLPDTEATAKALEQLRLRHAATDAVDA